MNSRRQVDELKQRVSRLTGEVLEGDFNVVHLVVAGDPEESCHVIPAGHGRYKYFIDKQWDEIAGIMRANGYIADGEHRWKRTLTPAEMTLRDKDAVRLEDSEVPQVAVLDSTIDESTVTGRAAHTAGFSVLEHR